MPTAGVGAVTPLQGGTTIDAQMVFEPERLSYDCAVQIAGRIADKASKLVRGQAVVIAGTRLLADFANLRAVYLQMQGLQSEYTSIGSRVRSRSERQTPVDVMNESFALGGAIAATGAAASVVSPVTSVVTAALGLVSLFRQDVEYHGEKTSVDGLAFEIALAAEVRAVGALKVYVPDLVALPAYQSDTGLAALLNLVLQAKADAWSSVGPLISELVRLEAGLDDAARSKDQAALDRLSLEVSSMRRDLAPIVDPLGKLDQRLSDLQSQLNQADPNSGLLQLARLLRAEALQRLDPLYLHATVVSTGGHYRITRNLFRTLFVGDGLTFAGGAIARWACLEKDGSVALGGIEGLSLTGKFGDSGQLEAPRERLAADPVSEVEPSSEVTAS